MSFVFQVLAAVAVPTTLFALAGRWLDTRFGTSPWATAVGLVIALGVSYVLVRRLAERHLKTLKSS